MLVFGRRLRLHFVAAGTVAVALFFVVAASAAGPIVITDPATCPAAGPCTGQNASPYPSTLTIAGAPAISTLVVQINGFTHDVPDDIDMLLESPGGGSVILMSDAGDSGSIFNPINFTFADAGTQLPCEGCASTSLSNNSTYAPHDYDNSPETTNVCLPFPFPSGIPDAGDPFSGSTTTLAGLGATSNGTWNLKVFDDCGEPDQQGPFGGGNIQNWCLLINGMSYGCSPTGFTIAAFVARRTGTTGKTAQVTWKTGQEATLAGFNVYRVRAGKSVKLNRALIPAKFIGQARGAAYKLVDATVKPGLAYTYRLQVLETSGTKTWASSTLLKKT